YSLNAFLYGLEGDYGNAGLSAMGMIPYAGDLAKVGKYGKKLCKVAKNGETKFTKAGRKAHQRYNPGANYDLNVRLPSGKKPDAVDFEKQIVRELKPDNPSAIRRGERQVETYRQELEDVFGGDWKS